jgi:hypothetical protein
MITGSEILKDLQTIKKKVEFAEITYPNNDIWIKVNNKLEDIISLLKNDIKLFGYD